MGHSYYHYLCHHGIKGQRWGERNGPPYPLKVSQKSSSEKKSIDKSESQEHIKSKAADRKASSWVSHYIRKHKNGNLTVIETIHKSVGAKSRNYDVWNPVFGQNMHFAEGTRLTQPKNHVIAGKGRRNSIDCEDWLNDKYPEAISGEWTKENGFGYVEDDYGEIWKVEVHWYDNPATGKVKFKIKETPGGEWFIEDV